MKDMTTLTVGMAMTMLAVNDDDRHGDDDEGYDDDEHVDRGACDTAWM